MIHHPSTTRPFHHRRQITPDSVVGTNILMHGTFADDCSLSASTVTVAATVINNSDPQFLPTPQIDQATQLLFTLQQEDSPHYKLTPNYLHSSILIPPTSEDSGVSERCRRKICEWMYELCDYFKLHREVVAIALFYVDRYFTITFRNGENPVTKREFQLIGLTALYIAIKTHGQSRQVEEDGVFNKLKFSLHVCASTSREQFTAAQIEQCECLMLTTLDWRLNPIVPSGCVIEQLVAFLPCAMGMSSMSEGSGTAGGGAEDDLMNHGQSVQNFVYDCATYLSELAVSVAALSLVYKPTVVAYASILASVDMLLVDSSSSRVTKETMIEYDLLLNRASHHHFESNKEEVAKAKEILAVMAPNLTVLFPSPFEGSSDSDEEPKSPTFIGVNALL